MNHHQQTAKDFKEWIKENPTSGKTKKFKKFKYSIFDDIADKNFEDARCRAKERSKNLNHLKRV